MSEIIKRWGEVRFYLFYNFSGTVSFLVEILLVTLKSLYIQHARILIMENQNCERWKDGDLSKILTISTTSLLLFGFSSYVVTNAGYYCAKITEGRNAVKFYILKLLKVNCSNTALHQCGSSFS